MKKTIKLIPNTLKKAKVKAEKKELVPQGMGTRKRNRNKPDIVAKVMMKMNIFDDSQKVKK